MNTSIQNPEPNGIVQPSGDSSQSGATLSAWRKLPGRFTFAALLAGLFLLLFSAPAARADRSPPNCLGSGLGISLFTSGPDAHVGDTICYSINVFNTAFPACDATAIQAFIVTPDGVSHPITLSRTTLLPGESDFYGNIVCYVVRAQDVLPDATVRATASDTGSIHQNDSNSTGGGFQGVNTEISLPCIKIAVQCVSSNDTINFTGTVTNCGNNTLVGVTITNFVNGGPVHVAFISILATNQVATFSGSWIPLNPCLPSTATFTAQGVDQFTTLPQTVTSSANTTCQTTLIPGIKVTKSCPIQPVSPGQPLTFSGSVSNTGNVTLTNIVVVNNQPVPNTQVFTWPSLAPGAALNFEGSYTAPTNCSVADTLTATGRSICGTVVTSSASATCPILTTPLIAVTALCPTGPVFPLGSLTYSGTVQNIGDTTLTNVVVVSDRPVPNTPVFSVASLAPGAIRTFTATYTVPANACAVTTTFSGTGKDICTPNIVTNSVSTTCPVTTAPNIAVTLVCPANNAVTGGLITYTGTVTNSGNVTLNNVTVVDNQASPSTVLFVPSLAPHASAPFTASFTAPTNACSVSSTVTATGNDNCNPQAVVTSTASATCTLNTTPLLVVTQLCPVTYQVAPGGQLFYSGTVSNAGNIMITNVVVLNNLSGATPVLTNATLAPGAVTNFFGSYFAPTNCSTTSTSTATGRSICGIAVTNSASATCPILTTPLIEVTALCPTAPVFPNGSLTYSGTVQNIGDITLTNVVVVSDRPVPNTPVFSVASLAPGAIRTFTSSVTVPPNACSVTTTFSGTGNDICTSKTATSSVSPTCPVTTAPNIAVTLACPTNNAVTGGLITYTGTVTNSGNVTLNNVTVVNSQSGTVLTVPSLLPHASAPFTASFSAPTNACSVSSTVTATGSDNCNPQAVVTSTASATCTLSTTAGIKVTKSCLQQVSPGQTLTFSGSVSNTGNVTLTNIVVVNNQPSNNTPVFTQAFLAPGEVATFYGSYVAPTNCAVTDTLTATGRSICGVAVTSTNSATCPILTTPVIVVTVSCPTNPAVQGGILTYSGTVSNAGNITLTNIIVVNNWPSGFSNIVIFTVPSLAPGATTNFTGSYLVPGNCCVAWIWVKASGQGCDGFTVTDTDSGACTVFTSPRIVVTKVCAPRRWPLRMGGLLTYSGTVSNAGNITLMNVTVVDNQPVPNTPVFGPDTLAPGESKTYTGSYTVPADFCGEDTVTASGFDACFGVPVTNSVTATCPITTTPLIGVSKQCPREFTPHGGLLTFTGTVTNMGNVTLVNVFVFNNQPSNNTPVIGPITLAPGASYDFSGSYTAPLVCCEIIDTLTARGQDRCSLSNVTATATAICPLLYTPGIALVQLGAGICPPNGIPMGSVYSFSGFVTNTGDAILTNVLVFSSQAGQNLLLLGPLDLAPGESEPYAGSLTVSNICAVTIIVTSQETCESTWITDTVSCPVVTTLGINIAERCPQEGQVTNGSTVFFDSRVCNTGNVPLNIVVYSGQPSIILPLGPITLDPGACTNFTGSYIATGGSNPTTNTNIVTHLPGSIWTTVTNVITTTNTVTFTTNTAIPFWFGTINSVGVPSIVDRFLVGSNFNGLVYAPEDHGYAATEFYSMHQDASSNFFDTIIASTGAVSNRFDAVKTNFDALAYSAPNLYGYGEKIFYYINHDNAGVSTFGTIVPGGTVGLTAPLFVVTNNVDVLTFVAANVGYGANMFYYIRHDATGLSTFGTIDPTPGGIITDRFAVGTNTTFVGLTFTDLTAPSFGANNFYYLRQDTNGLSWFGTIHLTQPPTPPISAVVTDRFTVGTNAVELTYTFDNPAFGANLFYFLRGRNFSVTSNSVTTYQTNAVTLYTTNTSDRVNIYTTNIVVSFTPTNTVTVIGTDICKDTVTAAADCFGPVGTLVLVIGTPNVNNDGYFSLTFPTVQGTLYYVQYKDALLDPAWTNLPGMPVTGTGAPWISYDPDPVFLHPSRFYRIMTP